MITERILRFEVPGREALEQMASEPLPFGLIEQHADLRFFRSVYFDTVSGDL